MHLAWFTWMVRYNWYDSNYGSSYTARKEEHVARILGSRFHQVGEGQDEEQEGSDDEEDDGEQSVARNLRPAASRVLGREDGGDAMGVGQGAKSIKEQAAGKQKTLEQAIYGKF